MNIGFGLDEGLSSPSDVYQIYYGERCACWFYVRAKGPVGHGSAFVTDTATERIARLMERVFEFRATQQREMRLRKKSNHGEVVTINLTSMKGGHTQNCGESFTMNVIPSVAQVGLDVRVPPQISQFAIEKMVEQWCNETMGGPENYEIVHVQRGCGTTGENPITDYHTEPFSKLFVKSVEQNLKLKTEYNIFPASTDARFVRLAGIPVIGFSPMINHPVLCTLCIITQFVTLLLLTNHLFICLFATVHDHDEYLTDTQYMEGIRIYVDIITTLTN